MEEMRDLDREAVIQRVWKRVMEGREEEALPHGSLQAEEGEMGVLPAPMPQSKSDFPTGAVFLGEGSLDMAPLLQEMIRHELEDVRAYQAIAKRVGGTQARVFQALAQEEKTHAKRLSAAYFLISGVRYWPEGGKTTPPTSYLGALRQRFGEEQAGMAAYLAGAEATSDPCLRQLFLDLAREEWEHACKIRTLVENA
jgi:rubrerythrin